MARKVFISVLGTGLYEKCKYEQSDETRFIQFATLQIITKNQDWCNNDHGYVFVTSKAKSLNWLTSETKTRIDFKTKEQIEYIGLEQELTKLNLPFAIEPKDIPNGENEKEIWDIFECIYTTLQTGDELYVDLTHSFRYIPMLLLALLQYARLLKKISVKSITYGNYEARIDGVAPIIDLTPIVNLQEWTEAADQFLTFGRIDKINALHFPILKERSRISQGKDREAKTLKIFSDTLDTITKQLLTCQGRDIIIAKEFEKAKQQIKEIVNVENSPTPFKPLIDSFCKIIDAYSTNTTTNIFTAAKDCLKNKEYQQAVTLLQEGIITLVAEKNGLDWGIEDDRNLISSALNVISKKVEKDNWKQPIKGKWKENISEYFNKIETIINTDVAKDICSLFSALTDIRNQYNHAGLLYNRQFDAKKLIERIEKLFEQYNNQLPILKDDISPQHSIMLLNLSNHPCKLWPDAQLQAAQEQFGTIQDLPFPQIAPDATEQDIQQLAEQYLKNIKDIGTPQQVTIHIMGELTFCFALVQLLKQNGYSCVASTTQRIVQQVDNNTKQATFQFVKFRKY